MRTITAVIIGFFLLAAFSLGTFRYVAASTGDLSGQLKQITASVQGQKWDKAREELKSAQNSWGKTKNWWSILLDHQEIDNIDISIEKVEKYIETQGTALALGELSALEMLVDHIADKEALNLKNIL